MEFVSIEAAGLVPKGRERWSEFQDNATATMSDYFGTLLKNVIISGFPKRFDMVSNDCQIVGDAKWKALPMDGAARKVLFEEISTYVWLLEKIKASRRFIVFGNDMRVPEAWLRKYGGLPTTVEFYFWDGKGSVIRLV